MKRLLVIALIFSSLININAQEIVLLNYNILGKKFNKSEVNIKDEKKGIASKTWFERGKLLQQIYIIDLEYIAEGTGSTEFKLYYKELLEEVTDEEDSSAQIYKFDRINYYFANGKLSKWERTKMVTENPLDKALEAYIKTLEFDAKQKYPEKVKEQLLLLKGNYMQNGINSYYFDDYENALHNFSKVLEVNKLDLFEGEIDTLMIQYSGIMARELKDYEKSAGFYTQLADLDWGGANIYLNIKNDYLAIEDSLSAIAIMEKGFEKYPDTLNIVANLVDLYVRTNKIEEGLETIDAAIAKSPEKGDLYYWKGRLLLNTDTDDRIDLALEVYKKAVEFNQSLYYVYYDIGFIYFLQGQDIYSQAGMERDTDRRAQINEIATEKYNLSIPMMTKAFELNNENQDIKRETLDVLKRVYYKLYGVEDSRYLDIMEKINNL